MGKNIGVCENSNRGFVCHNFTCLTDAFSYIKRHCSYHGSIGELVAKATNAMNHGSSCDFGAIPGVYRIYATDEEA